MRPVRITSWYSKFNGKPFWLATQLYPYNDWTWRQNVVTYDVIAEAPFEDRVIKV